MEEQSIFKDLVFQRDLGKGRTATVTLVKNSKNKCYALK